MCTLKIISRFAPKIRVIIINPIRSGLFQTVNDPGEGALKAPLPLRSQKLFCQSAPYHTCAFYQMFQACSNWNF